MKFEVEVIKGAVYRAHNEEKKRQCTEEEELDGTEIRD